MADLGPGQAPPTFNDAGAVAGVELPEKLLREKYTHRQRLRRDGRPHGTGPAGTLAAYGAAVMRREG